MDLAALCPANTEGGTLYLGVEDDRSITGLLPEHEHLTQLAAIIARRTVPSLSVRTELIEEEGTRVASIHVPRSERLVATSDRMLQRRRARADGTPECAPFPPHEFATRASYLRQLDYAALPIIEATLGDLDSVERQRIRQAIEQYHGDRALLDLSDDSQNGALGLTSTAGGKRVPTVAGFLLIGNEGAFRTYIPSHEVLLQELDGSTVRANDFYRWPLVRLYEHIAQFYRARVVEEEMQVGLFGYPCVYWITGHSERP